VALAIVVARPRPHGVGPQCRAIIPLLPRRRGAGARLPYRRVCRRRSPVIERAIRQLHSSSTVDQTIASRFGKPEAAGTSAVQACKSVGRTEAAQERWERTRRTDPRARPVCALARRHICRIRSRSTRPRAEAIGSPCFLRFIRFGRDHHQVGVGGHARVMTPIGALPASQVVVLAAFLEFVWF
jgi:hypothetical protein